MTACPSCGQSIPTDARYCGACGHQSADTSERKGLVGTTIADRYRVLRVIAEGGMGIVYEAEQSMGEGVRRVAIKTLLPELSRDPVVVSRFNRECSVVAGLEHPNTVRVYDFGTTDEGSLYIAMEFVGGRPLGDVIAEGPMPLPRCLGIMEQIASALEEAHNQGIVHRDLKPDNLVLCDRAGLHDFVKVLDFGIAKRSSVGGRHDTNLTQQGMVLGTPPYMSPEQFTGEPLDQTSDVYSLGIIFYEMMNSKLPFDGDTPWQWAHQHISVEPAPFVVPVPHELQEVVHLALSKQKSERPQSALEFYRRLCSASEASPRSLSRVTEPSKVVSAWPGSVIKGDTSSEAPALGVRTEPSMARMAAEPHTLDDGNDASLAMGTTAPAGPALSVCVRSGTGTDPGGLRTGVVGLPRVATGVTPAPAPMQRGGASSRRPRRPWVLGICLLSIAAGASGALIWWVSSQRSVLDEPPRPTPLSTDSVAAEIVVESEQAPIFAADSPRPATPSVTDNVVTNPATPRPLPSSSASGHATTPASAQPIPAPATAGTPVSSTTASHPFPIPFPIALPSIFTPSGLPPLALPTPGSTSTPAPTPTVSQPTPTVPEVGMQQCARATTLADTDLDAAVGQYQLCESAVGRTAATAARAKIASVGVARAAALASQGRCDEANRVVQTLSRIGAHRNAQRAMAQAGCRT